MMVHVGCTTTSNHGDWGLIYTTINGVICIVENSMAVDNECVQYEYEYNNQPRVLIPNQQKLIAERAGTASYYVGHRYKLHRHTQQSSGDNIYNNNGWGCNIIHNNQKGAS